MPDDLIKLKLFITLNYNYLCACNGTKETYQFMPSSFLYSGMATSLALFFFDRYEQERILIYFFVFFKLIILETSTD